MSPSAHVSSRRVSRGLLPRLQNRPHAHRHRRGRGRRCRFASPADTAAASTTTAADPGSGIRARRRTPRAVPRAPARNVAHTGPTPFPIVSERERIAPPMTASDGTSGDLELLLRRIIREEAGLTPAVPAEKWRGGTFVLRPGAAGPAGKELADRDVLPQDRHAAEPSAHARAAGQRRRPAR